MADRDDVPEPPGRRGRPEVWIGLFVLVGLISGLAVLFTMTDPAMFRGRYIIKTVVTDAGGIRKGEPVQMVGVVVGRVLSFRIEKDEKVTIQLEIEGEYSIPKDSHMVLKAKSLFGEMMADIVRGTSSEVVKQGDVLPGQLEAPLVKATEGLPEKASDIMVRVQTLLGDTTLKNVEGSTKELNTLLAELNQTALEQRKELLAMSKSLRKSAEGFEKSATSPELQAAIKRTDALTAQMDEAVKSLDRSSKSLETVMARLEKGEGTMGKLLKDEALYKNLNESVVNANKLLVDLRENPKRYVKLSFF